MLERYDGKLSRTVLRRESGSNARDLSGKKKYMINYIPLVIKSIISLFGVVLAILSIFKDWKFYKRNTNVNKNINQVLIKLWILFGLISVLSIWLNPFIEKGGSRLAPPPLLALVPIVTERHFSFGYRLGNHSLLHKSTENKSTTTRVTSIEPKCKFLQVRLEVSRDKRTLVST